MLTQPLEMTLARRQWHKHFVAQLGSRLLQHPGADMEDHWEEMVYYRNRYAELRQSWARERTAVALAEAQAEVTRLRAENAKHRAALDEVAGIAGRAGFIYSGSAANVFVLICSVAAIAALETAPAGEASHENG